MLDGEIRKHLATLIYSSVLATIEIYAYRFQLRRNQRSAESNQLKFVIVVEGKKQMRLRVGGGSKSMFIPRLTKRASFYSIFFPRKRSIRNVKLESIFP